MSQLTPIFIHLPFSCVQAAGSSYCLTFYGVDVKCLLVFFWKSKSKRKEPSDSEEDKMETKKRRRIKKPQSDSSDDDDGEAPSSSPPPPHPPHFLPLIDPSIREQWNTLWGAWVSSSLFCEILTLNLWFLYFSVSMYALLFRKLYQHKTV